MAEQPQEDKDRMYAMMRYISLYEKFPMQTQTVITNKFGTRLHFKKYTPTEINGICDTLSKALFLEQQRLHDLYCTEILKEEKTNG